MRTPNYWHHRDVLSIFLSPLTLIYGFGAWLDRHTTKPQRASLPTIAIGNVTVGGAGKTPTTLALVPLLRSFGHTPHILTRGYKGTIKTTHRVLDTDIPYTVGDEALLLATAAPTWVGHDRIASAKAAAQAGASILICDDALQHHRIAKDISLLVIDGPYGIGNGMLLPSGPLRETLTAALARSDAAILIGEDARGITRDLHIPVFRTGLKPTGDISTFTKGQWLAFAGIGRPEKFYTSLRDLGAQVIATRDFPDHHTYTKSEIEALIDQARTLNVRLVTTTKDAVKIPPSLKSLIHVLPVELVLEDPAAFSTFLTARLAQKTGA